VREPVEKIKRKSEETQVAECTQFSPDADLFPKPLLERTRDVLVLYFEEPQAELGVAEIDAIESWVQQHGEARGFQVDGHADPCGSAEANQKLSEARAREAAHVLDLAYQAHIGEPQGVRTPPIVPRGHGETDAWTHHEAFRRVEIRPLEARTPAPPQLRALTAQAGIGRCHAPASARPIVSPKVAGALSRHPSDVLLLDQSESMFPHWETVQSHPETRRARVWLSTTEHGGKPPIELAQAKPEGSTEIFRSLYTLILAGKVRPGERVLVLSDFDSNHPLTREGLEIIRAAARRKQVRICGIDVRTGLPYEPARPGGSRRQDGDFNAWEGINQCEDGSPGGGSRPSFGARTR
jgi:hypothetical protein